MSADLILLAVMVFVISAAVTWAFLTIKDELDG